jgi:hypothetical protein
MLKLKITSSSGVIEISFAHAVYNAAKYCGENGKN